MTGIWPPSLGVPVVESRVPVEGLSHLDRRDPYWMPFVADRAAAWVDPTLDGEADLIAAVERLLRGKKLRERRLRTLGAVGQWRTLTADQSRAVVGQEAATRRNSDVEVLHAAGVLERQVLFYASESGQWTQTRVYRPCTGRAASRLLDSVTPWEHIAVTDERPWGRGPSYSRHNVLAAELGLRAAEYTWAAGVVGERVGSLRGDGSAPIADVTLYRPDGLRVLVEVTATASTKDAEKIERYAEWLRENPHVPVVVLFVVAVPAGRGELNYVTSGLRRHIDEACDWSSKSDNLEDRFGVVRWKDWFPSAHEIDSSFETLRVEQPVFGGGDWRETDLFERGVLEGRCGKEDVHRMTRARASAGCPFWLRVDNPDEVIGEAVSDAARRSSLGPSLAWIYDFEFPGEEVARG